MRNVLGFIALLSLSIALGVPQAVQAKGSKQPAPEKVAFQVSEPNPGKLKIALNAAQNVFKTYGKQSKVEVVVYGPGIQLFTLDSQYGELIDEAIKSGVRVVVCQNTMQSLKLTEGDMLPALTYVPGGILHLMQRQKQGYAYIQP